MRLGLVYLPAAATSDAMVSFARELVVGREARMVVGENALPHLTLLHVETDASPALLFEAAKAKLPARLRFDVVSLGLLRYDTPYNADPAPPATMAWLLVPCTEALRAAERVSLGLPGFRNANVTTGNGDAFVPHLTIAMWEGHLPPTTFAPTRDDVFAKGIEGALALGVIGKNGTFERVLAGGWPA